MNKENSSLMSGVRKKSRFLAAVRLGMTAPGVIAVAVCLGWMALASQAQQAEPTGVRGLTLREAVELALANNRNIQLAQAGADRAAAEHEEARSIFRPQVFLGSGLAASKGFPMSIEGSAPSIFQISTSQALFDRNLRNLERTASQMRQAAGKSLVETQDQIVAETALTYLDLDRSRASLEYLRSEAETLQAAEPITSERVAAGLELPLEATRAQLATARARSQLAALENQISLLEFRLRDMTGIAQSVPIATQPAEVPGLAPDETLEGLTARALENNPGLRALDDEVRAKEFQVRSEQGSRWPRINLVGQYGLFSKFNNYEDFFRRFERHNATFGASIVVPLYQREGYNARLSKAEAELAAARYRREESRAALSRQVRELWGVIQQQASAREVRRLELDLARKSLDAVLAQFEEGRVNRLVVEQSRVEENRAWVNLLNADFESERARLELWRLTGEIRAAIR